MWGASSFEEHPVAKMVMQAAILLEEHGWSQLTIPFCDREFLDNALRGSMFFAETTKCSSLSQLYFHDFRGASAVSVPPPWSRPKRQFRASRGHDVVARLGG